MDALVYYYIDTDWEVIKVAYPISVGHVSFLDFAATNSLCMGFMNYSKIYHFYYPPSVCKLDRMPPSCVIDPAYLEVWPPERARNHTGVSLYVSLDRIRRKPTRRPSKFRPPA